MTYVIYVDEPSAREKWHQVCGAESVVIDKLNLLDQVNTPIEDVVLIFQIRTAEDISHIQSFVSQGYNIIAVNNNPSDQEGLGLFRSGIKAYANTFASQNRIRQILDTLAAGNVWLGHSIMQALITATASAAPMPAVPQENNEWKQLLTDREVQTTEEVLQGKPNKQIANDLGISERTVKAHLKSVFEKLEVTDRLALVLKIKNGV